MDSLSASVAPPIVFLAGNHHHRRRISFIPGAISSHSDRRFQCLSKHRIRRRVEVWCKLSNQGDVDREKDEDKNDDEEVKKALELDGTIPSTSDEFVKQVSSRAYDMRRHLQQSFDSSSYDVLESNPWRDTSKPVYVLTQRENQLCTMKTRRNRSEVESELSKLFSKGGKWRNQAKQSGKTTKFEMLVEDISEGVLTFRILSRYQLAEFELCVLGNLCPETVEEAIAMVPSIRSRGRGLDDDAIEKMLHDLSLIKKFD